MSSLQTLLRRIYNDISQLEGDDFKRSTRELLNGKSKSSVLTGIFAEFQSSLSASLIANLAFWFEDITYQDIMQTMIDVGNSSLPAYHFSAYVPELFGVDIIKAALEAQQEHPELKERLSYFVNLNNLIEPRKNTIENLKELGASPEKIRDNLLKTGAPLLPWPTH